MSKLVDNMVLKPGTSETPPVWFCGDAKEWKFVRVAVDKAGWSLSRRMAKTKWELSKLPGATDYYLANKRYDGDSDFSDNALLGSAVGAVGTALYVGGHILMRALETGDVLPGIGYGVFFGGIGAVVGVLGGGLGFSLIGKLNAKVITPLIERVVGNGEAWKNDQAERIGEQRLREISQIARKAEAHLMSDETREEAEEARRVAAVLDLEIKNLIQRQAIRVEPDKREKKEKRLNEVAEKLRNENPESFKTHQQDAPILKVSTLEGRLSRLGEAGMDGLAAVALWKGMQNLERQMEMERDMDLLDRIPRLLSAFESVPENERDKCNELLGGETAEGSLRRGLAAALDRALAARKNLTEKALINTEAEARVLELASHKLK